MFTYLVPIQGLHPLFNRLHCKISSQVFCTQKCIQHRDCQFYTLTNYQTYIYIYIDDL